MNKFDDTFTRLAVLTQYRRVTARQTFCDSIVRAMDKHHAVKNDTLSLHTF